jgi:glycine dehydrogenase
LADVGGDKAPGPVSAAPYGSAGILPISWMYIRLMGEEGLRRASEVAVLNANYMADRLDGEYPVLYRGDEGRVAHEFIIDCRDFRQDHEVTVGDMAKRLMDFGFHAPTMSWPVHETMMIEPTESESKAELDRFCEALIAIRSEIQAIQDGEVDVEASALRRAPHTAESLVDDWDRSYGRRQAVYPADWVKDDKFWPSVARVDDAFGDRNLMCACPDIDELAD